MITSTVVSQGRAQAREIVESPEIRAVRISKGMLLTAIGILLMVMPSRKCSCLPSKCPGCLSCCCAPC